METVRQDTAIFYRLETNCTIDVTQITNAIYVLTLKISNLTRCHTYVYVEN